MRATSEPGKPSGKHIDMISALNCDGGRWVPGTVFQHTFRQDDWCPEFYCAYVVIVDGDGTLVTALDAFWTRFASGPKLDLPHLRKGSVHT